jgi:hypothetical protein
VGSELTGELNLHGVELPLELDPERLGRPLLQILQTREEILGLALGGTEQPAVRIPRERQPCLVRLQAELLALGVCHVQLDQRHGPNGTVRYRPSPRVSIRDPVPPVPRVPSPRGPV